MPIAVGRIAFSAGILLLTPPRFKLRFFGMSTVAEIIAAIPSLTLEERAEVARHLNDWQDDVWDEQMKRDAAAGKFESLNREADAAHGTGKAIPLDAILRES